MVIAIYSEPLRIPTTGTPMRNMIKMLLKKRSNDHFVFILRGEYRSDRILLKFFEDISVFDNWEISLEKRSRKRSNFLGLLRYPGYCKVHHSADIFLNPDANTLGKRAHPLIVTVADMSSFRPLKYTSYKRKWQLWLRRFMLSDAIKRAERIVAISEFTQTDILKFFPEEGHKISIIYNGIDPLWFDLPELPVQESDKLPYWVWWGTISNRKNLLGLLEAYKGVISQDNKTSLPAIRIIYTNSEIPEEIKHFVILNELENNISFIQSLPLEDLIITVSQSKGLVFPSFMEGFGMPVVEAMSRGVPVLTSNTTSLKEVSGDFAIYVDPIDITSIKEGLVRLVNEDNCLEQRILRKNWATRFSPSTAAKEFSKLIDTFQ